MRAVYLLSILAVILAGCSEGQDTAAEEHPRDEHVWQDQVQALEKAKSVEKTIQDASSRQFPALDQEGKGDER